MIMLYGLGLFAARVRARDSPISATLDEPTCRTARSLGSPSCCWLCHVGVVWLSETLVHGAQDVIGSLGISEFFLGIILVPLIGNVAEHLVAVQVAAKNKMDLSTEIAISSSLQIALFVAPLLVFVSLLLGHPLQLIFNQFELLALLASVVIAVLVSADGEFTWLEGAALLAIYVILGLAFFVLP